jgi:hypothetical protein
MSRNNINNKRTFNKYEQEQKKFCSVCKKAGKSEREYTSHYTKSVPGPKGIPTCPIILSSECTFCHQKGHWASEDHCPALIEKKRMQKITDQAYDNRREYMKGLQQQEEKKQKQNEIQKFGGYAAFNYVAPVAPTIVEEFPALGKVVPKTIEKIAISYSTMAKKEAPLKCQQEAYASAQNFTVLTTAAVKEYEKQSKQQPFQEAVNKAMNGNFEFQDFEQDFEQNDDDDDGYSTENEELHRIWCSNSKRARV